MRFDSTYLLLTVSVVGSAIAAPAPAPGPSSQPGHIFVKRQPGAVFKRFGTCNMPAKVGVEIKQPTYPAAKTFSTVTSAKNAPRAGGKTSAGKQEAYRKLMAVPRWYTASFDKADLSKGLKLIQVQSPDVAVKNVPNPVPDPDNLAALEPLIIFEVKDDGNGGLKTIVGGDKNIQTHHVNVDHAWETYLMEEFLKEQLKDAQACHDFTTTVFKGDMTPLMKLYQEMPGLDHTKGTGHADFVGMDIQLNSMKGIIIGRGWAARKNVKTDGSLAAMELAAAMERVTIAFELMNKAYFKDIFKTTNQRMHAKIGELIDTEIKSAKTANAAGVLDDNWADSFKKFIDDRLDDAEKQVWVWWADAKKCLKDTIAKEWKANTIKAAEHDNLNARYALIDNKLEANFKFDRAMAALP